MGPASAGLRHAQTQRTPPHPRSMLAIVHEAQAASYIVKKLPHMDTCRQELLCSALLPLLHESDPRAGLLPKLDALYFSLCIICPRQEEERSKHKGGIFWGLSSG